MYADSKDSSGDLQAVRRFSSSGRIGRARYILYVSSLLLLVLLITIVVMSSVHSMTVVAVGLIALPFAAVLALFTAVTIQRCHDFGVRGALAVLGFVPFLNLFFWLVPGSRGPNRFGPPPPPNSAAVVLAACIVPALLVALIAATTLVPSLDRP